METEKKVGGMVPGRLDACFRELAGSDAPLALATVVQSAHSTSGKAGARALVGADGIVEGWIGGGCAQPAVIAAARKALETGEPSLIRVGPKGEWQALEGVADFSSGCLSGGTQVIFVEPLSRQARLCVLGDSPVAVELCALAAKLDFAVTLSSPGVDSERLPAALEWYANFDNVQGDFVVVATQGRNDRVALKAALDSDARYIGMIASRKKISALKASLAKSAVDAERLQRIHSPAGIDIGAVTPSEIALSILAEMVSERRRGGLANRKTQGGKQQHGASAMSADGDTGCCGSHG